MAPGAARGRSPVERALQGSRGRPPAGSGGGGLRLPAVNIPGAARALAPLGRLAGPAAMLGTAAYVLPRVFNPKDNIMTSAQNLGTAIENLGRPPGRKAAYVGSDPAAVQANRRNQGGEYYGPGFMDTSSARNSGVGGGNAGASTQLPMGGSDPGRSWTPIVTPRARAQAERMNELSQQAGGADYSYREAFPRQYAAAESAKSVVEQYRRDLQSNPLADLPELIDQRSQAYGQRADIAKWLETMQAGGDTQKEIARRFLAKQRPAPTSISEEGLFRPGEMERAVADTGYANIQIDPAAMAGASAMGPVDRFEQPDARWKNSYGVGDGSLQSPALPGSREEALGFSEPFLPADAMRESNLSGNEALSTVAPQQAAKITADRDAAESGYADVNMPLLKQHLQRAQKLNAARFN